MTKQTSFTRAMANTVCDHGTDPTDHVAVATILIRAGFPAKLIEVYFEDVVCMAYIRWTNEQRKKHDATLLLGQRGRTDNSTLPAPDFAARLDTPFTFHQGDSGKASGPARGPTDRTTGIPTGTTRAPTAGQLPDNNLI
jgi:hypothetical protein